MDNVIDGKFRDIGARVRVTREPGAAFSMDVVEDGRGECFTVRHGENVRVTVLDARPKDRHLLLMAREPGADRKSKFLCGHDERHWFVAAVPETASARDVQTAKDALKPRQVWDAMRRFGVRMADRDKRHTDGFIRQGEWFFIPRPELQVNEKLVLKNEPIRRGAGKPHVCQTLYRVGGEQVWVSRDYPNGLSVTEYRALPHDKRRRQTWRPMVRDARVYVRGTVRHRDHKTVWLRCWHEVVVNTESSSLAMRNVAFLD